MSWVPQPGNPYQSQPHYPPQVNPQVVRDRITPAGIALLVVGSIGCILMVLYTIVSLVSFFFLQSQNQFQNRNPAAFYSGLLIPHLMYLFNASVNGVVAFAGFNMMKFRNYMLCMIGSILAVIPLISACCFLGIPFGIWGIIVLSSEGARDVFSD